MKTLISEYVLAAIEMVAGIGIAYSVIWFMSQMMSRA